MTVRKFVDHACQKDPRNPRFVDTLGYVTFRFAGCRLEATKVEDTEKDLIKAAKLFMQASKFARSLDQPDLAEIADLHYEQVDEALGKLS